MIRLRGHKALTWPAILFCLYTASARADLEDVLRAEELKRQSAIERFSLFTSDKNVMGEAMRPDGSVIQAKQKQRFDRDGAKLLSFQSDLTYHAKAFDTVEEVKKGDDPNESEDTKVRRLYGFVSDHGKASEAGGSSALERKMYGLHEQFSEDEDANKSQEEGVEFKSIFKVTTKEVQSQDKKAAENNEKNGEDDTISVARWEMRPEALQGAASVGEDASKTVIDAAKDPDAKNDDTKLSNGVLLREAANRGLKAIDASTLKGLKQRQANRGIKDGGAPQRVQLREDLAKCDDWAGQAAAQIPEASDDPKRQEDMQKEIDRMRDQCRQMTALNWRTINPKFEDDGQGNETLKSGGVDEEDARIRDLRVQLEMNRRFGIKANDVPNNWGYGQNEGSGKVVLAFDENGNPTKQVELHPADQIRIFNEARQDAKQATEEVNALLPDNNKLDTSQLTAIPIGQISSSEITKNNAEAKADLYITAPGPGESKTIEQYDDLVE